ncbi:putative ATP-grasp-modified RiPP [Streptomyces sp. NPDC059247]|uniref:putative ATP-grasp-modified RiPP n=1 Tax=Streptomyces sp. NPDC059247 TaxID=3346790 RepID=UPI0036CE525F
MADSITGAPSRALGAEATGGRERLRRHVEDRTAYSTGPDGYENRPPATTEKPWGLERLAPYVLTVPVPYARIEIDPVTQTTRYLGPDGWSVDMGEHGTNTATATATATGADGGGTRPPQPADTDALEDHASD